MKIRIRNRKITKVLEVDENSKLSDLDQFVYGLFDNRIPREFFLSLNGNDPITSVKSNSENELNNDVTLKDCNIVGGDLLHIISLDEEDVVSQQNSKIECDSAKANLGNKDVAMETDQTDSHVNEITQSSSDNSNSGYPGIGDDSSTSEAGPSNYQAVPMEEEPIDHAVVNKCLSEPLLCRDCVQGTLPPLLKKVYQESGVNSTNEALIVALHIMMLESGYVPAHITSDADTRNHSTDLMNTDWNKDSPGCYKLKYIHKSCPETDVFTVVLVKMGKLLIVHGLSPDKDDKKCQMKVNSDDFVQSVHCEICDVYRNLPKLSMLFKDAISIPMLQTFRQNHGYPVLDGMMALSQEVMLTILSYLDVSSSLRLTEVSKDFKELGRDRYLWRRHYLKDFGNRQNNDLTQDWYSLYKIEYQLRKQREKERRRYLSQMTCIVPPVFRPPPDPGFPSPFPPYPPGIIGGDFDLFPQFPGPSRSGGHNPLQPLQPRFDPYGPSPDMIHRPGRGGGIRDNRGPFGRISGPRFF